MSEPREETDFDSLKDEYQAFYDSCVVREEKAGDVAYYMKKLKGSKDTYGAVGLELGGIPWYFIGIIHALESSFNFGAHLHNGDPLSARTVQVPAGRPKSGTPPFTWQESAEDAMRMKGFDKVTDWSVPHMLYMWERYNGFGYRPRRVPTPYLWSFSNHHTKGKFVADGKYDPNAISGQCGAAVMLKELGVT